MSKMNKVLVVYHANCIDGIFAAWAAYKYFSFVRQSTVEYLAADYSKTSNDNILTRWQTREYDYLYMLDYSVKLDVLDKLTDAHPAGHITIVDHHKSAFKELLGIEEPNPIEKVKGVLSNGTKVHLDNSKSGAVLTWEHFLPAAPMPELLNIVQDHDLWRFEYPETKAMSVYLKEHLKQNRDSRNLLWALDKVVKLWTTSTGKELLLDRANEMLRQQQEKVQYIVDNRSSLITILGKPCYLASVDKEDKDLVSDVGNILAAKNDTLAIMVSYDEKTNSVIHSLRSTKTSGIDCSKIAEGFGGGGHANAAGFIISLDKLLKEGGLKYERLEH
jgi:oligoribonuclease NrnB/cAMP/cGMP phosphodiesterase (DHH superfamily)